MEEQHINRLVEATKNSLEEMSIEQLKTLEKQVKQEISRRTIAIVDKE